MNLYLITQKQITGYDTYDSSIVAAESEEEAKTIHASGGRWDEYTWCDCAAHVQAELVGLANPETKSGVILSSFNAG